MKYECYVFLLNDPSPLMLIYICFLRSQSPGELLLEEGSENYPKGTSETPSRANQVPDRRPPTQSDQSNPTVTSGRRPFQTTWIM